MRSIASKSIGTLVLGLIASGCGASTELDDSNNPAVDGGKADGGEVLVDGSSSRSDAADASTVADAIVPPLEPAFVEFGTEVGALPDFGWSSGLQPPGSPVQLELSISSSGTGAVEARAQSSGTAEEPVLTAVEQSGVVSIDGAFTVEARLAIGITGLPKYDGPIPVIGDYEFSFSGEQLFDPYLLGERATAEAEVPAVELPAVPLPGGLPGNLIFGVAEDSSVNLTFSGVCAAIEGDRAQYIGTLARGGSFKLLARVEVNVPGLGFQTFDIPTFAVPITLPAQDVDLGTRTVEFGSPPEAPGETAILGRCD